MEDEVAIARLLSDNLRNILGNTLLSHELDVVGTKLRLVLVALTGYITVIIDSLRPGHRIKTRLAHYALAVYL